MRKYFKQQLELGQTCIKDVEIYRKSRHELAPLLVALQEIFVTTELNQKVGDLLKKNLLSKNNHTGAPGMDLWTIFVLAMVRQNMNLDYDALTDYANNHHELRGIMGVRLDGISYNDKRQQKFNYQTIKDNVSMLDEALLQDINELIVNHATQVKKKEGADIPLQIKADSFALKANVHFPTDLRLLYDSMKSGLLASKRLNGAIRRLDLTGRIQVKKWERISKSEYRKVSEIHRKKGANYKSRLESAATIYLDLAREVLGRFEVQIAVLGQNEGLTEKEIKKLKCLTKYSNYGYTFVDQIDRRILKGETIPHEEKIFSIYEDYSEWIDKGKYPKQITIGKQVLIATDQQNFIHYWKVYEHSHDKKEAQICGQTIAKRYTDKDSRKLESISFDRGFYSELNKKHLEKMYSKVIMPKAGDYQTVNLDEESKELQRRHSIIESNINELQHTGLDKCMDRSLEGFKRYVAMSVVAYNLKKWGLVLMRQQRKKRLLVGKAA